ncbi:MAG: hypothetical protein ACHBN1_28245 [Heteroscytonema crispum UTEX LB 1556]
MSRFVLIGARYEKTSIARFVPGGVELENGDRLQADVVIFGTGFRQDMPFLDEKYRQMVIDMQGNFYLYRHLINPDVPNMGFVGYSSNFDGLRAPRLLEEAGDLTTLNSERVYVANY